MMYSCGEISFPLLNIRIYQRIEHYFVSVGSDFLFVR